MAAASDSGVLKVVVKKPRREEDEAAGSFAGSEEAKSGDTLAIDLVLLHKEDRTCSANDSGVSLETAKIKMHILVTAFQLQRPIMVKKLFFRNR